MKSILGIIILVLDILAVIDILKSSMTGGKKVLWVLLIVFLPIIGLILYYLVGKKKG